MKCRFCNEEIKKGFFCLPCEKEAEEILIQIQKEEWRYQMMKDRMEKYL